MKTTSLTLTRREGEALIIDHDIRVTIKQAQGGQVSINIQAPENVDVIREELEGVWPVED
ncbi:carbon storage regulator [Marinobacterium litorale]|uniref:carbon storage regulator n=1 Tax=Marinobacterium litorale TaxID=404770 RepID=UPI00042634CF|nr:carbon storage regulator [Marinobacterium litorale]